MSKFAYITKSIFLAGILYFVHRNETIPEVIQWAIPWICLILIISPRCWFGTKNLFCKPFRKNQIIGIPDPDKLNILIMLFRLRCREIYSVYSFLRYRQEKAAPDENWISLHLKEEALSYVSELDYYSSKKEAKIEKNERKAQEIFYKHFNFDKFSYDTEKTINAATDLEIEISLLYMESPDLEIIKSFGCFQTELSSLINNRRFLGDTYQEDFSRFDDFIINRIGKDERRIAYRSIKSSWKKLFDILKMYLIYFENHREMKDLAKSLLKEMELLEEMTSGLSYALRQENAQSKRSIGSPSEVNEKTFFAKFDSNPI